MSDEKRRYFRIDENVGIGYEFIERHKSGQLAHKDTQAFGARMENILDIIEEQDAKIDHLMATLADQNPVVAEVIGLFNQKLERVINHLLMDSHTLSRIAHKVKEANISACGIGFVNNEFVEEGASLRLQLLFSPGNLAIETNGRVVSCSSNGDGESYYWRIDFFGMSKKDQEDLIQHIVKTQGSQLKNKT
ncbi:PilZ domain-containing protein [Teredinibacter purpureus]|uniref:PilZ domain-containing protein n=1 Tax=Teredinibacter purpureus TaxID=2731756 RepID=UPI0005F81D6A|nr:PilZ domain-containing protein [Teredinibacter purpureus]